MILMRLECKVSFFPIPSTFTGSFLQIPLVINRDVGHPTATALALR